MVVHCAGTDAASAARLEQQLLSAFWYSAQDVGRRLQVLLDFTRVIVIRAEGWDAAAVRREHEHRHAAGSTITLDKALCFGCGATGQLYAHHIIEIQNGGSNAVRNQVPLCFDCHQYLHPWLTEADRVGPRQKAAFTALAELAPGIFAGLVDGVDRKGRR